jgi:competence protein CoiA
MKFAIFNDIRIEALKGAKGFCQNCGSELIAKCGRFKINHWAHKGLRNCDSWWEPETDWHRSWKKNFPNDWQEISLWDESTNEKHIADVCTKNGLVIEFQHSHIEPLERMSREKFYKNMVWVVDCTRLKRDYPRFLKGFTAECYKTTQEGIFEFNFAEDYFPVAWYESSVPVIFDFKGTELSDVEEIKNHLYCLFPTKKCRRAILAKFSRSAFIKSVNLDEWSNRVNNFFT